MERNIETSESNDFFIPESIKQNIPERQESPKEIEVPEIKEEIETPVENVEEKPWKIDENGKKISTMVPKQRFDEKNNLAKELEAKLKERDLKLQEIEEQEKKINVDLSHIKLEDYEKFEDYMSALQKESNKIQRLILKQEIEQEKIVEKVKTAESNLIQGFDKNIEETVSEIPDIVNVVSEFAKYKEYIPRETIYTIMGDENSAKVIHEIMTTENMLRNLSEMSPVQAARVIGKMSAKFDLQKEYSETKSQSPSEKPTGIPSTPIPSRPKVAGSPSLKGATDISTIRVDDNDESIASYRASKPKRLRR